MSAFEYVTSGTFEARPFDARRRHVWGTYRVGDGLACTLWLESRASVWELSGVTIHAERDEVSAGPALTVTTRDLAERASTETPPAVTARLLRDLSLGAIAADLRQRVAANQPRFAPTIERRPGRRQPDEFYAEVAAAYVAALDGGSRSPVRDLASVRGYSTSMVNNWIYEARQRGLLTEAPPGRAGGELTEQARALLAQEDDR